MVLIKTVILSMMNTFNPPVLTFVCLDSPHYCCPVRQLTVVSPPPVEQRLLQIEVALELLRLRFSRTLKLVMRLDL